MQPNLTDDARRVIAELGPLNRRFAGKTILLSGAAGFWAATSSIISWP